MNTPTARFPNSLPTRFRVVLMVGLAVGLATLGPRQLSAQVEETDLEATPAVDTDVADVGARYPEVGDAIVRFRNGDYQGARQLLDNARQKYTELPPGGVMLAQLFIAGNNAAAARASLEGVVSSEANDPEAYIVFGNLATRERRITDAELQYAHASRLCESLSGNPTRKENLQLRALSGLAAVAEARKNWQQAMDHLQAMAKIKPGNVTVQTRLARALFKLGGKEREGQAYTIFQKLWSDDNSRTRAEVNMAVLYHQAEREPNAKKLFELATERDSKGLRTHLAAARWALDMGEVDLAKAWAGKAQQIDSESAQAHLYAGLAARFEKDYASAAAAFEQAHLKQPASFDAVNNLALSLVELPDEAQRRRALEFAQMNSRAFSELNQQAGRESAVTLAWLIFQLGREAEAESALQRVIRVGGSISAEGAYFAAKILQARGKPESALQILGPALQQRGEFPSRTDAEDLLTRLRSPG